VQAAEARRERVARRCLSPPDPARAACVYEVAFLSPVEALAESQPLVLYGASAGILGEMLAAAGYTDLAVFEGGLEAWEAAGGELEGNAALPSHPVLDGVYRVDPTESVVRWTGRNLFNHHSGTLKPASGELRFRGNRLIGGQVVLDMNTIACENLARSAVNAILIRHLRDGDFFWWTGFPRRKWWCAKRSDRGSTVGTPNWSACGRHPARRHAAAEVPC
jgi:hypothetical protein